MIEINFDTEKDIQSNLIIYKQRLSDYYSDMINDAIQLISKGIPENRVEEYDILIKVVKKLKEIRLGITSKHEGEADYNEILEFSWKSLNNQTSKEDYNKFIELGIFHNSIMLNGVEGFIKKFYKKIEEFKKNYPIDYQQYLSKRTISEPVQEKIKWLKHGSDLGYIIRQLSEYGYIEIPDNLRGKPDYTKIAKILEKAFDVDAKLDTIRDSLGSKLDRTQTNYSKALKEVKIEECLIIPPAYSLKK